MTPPEALGPWHLVTMTFLVTCLGETGFPLPLLLSGVLLFTGYQLAQGEVLLAVIIVAASVAGSLIGALSVYGLSSALGRPFFARVWRLLRLREEWWTAAERRLGKVDALSVAQARLVPGLALPVSVIAGAGRASIPRFCCGVMGSELVWLPPFLGIGLLAGLSGIDLSGFVEWVPLALIGLALVIAGVRIAQLLLRRPGTPQT